MVLLISFETILLKVANKSKKEGEVKVKLCMLYFSSFFYVVCFSIAVHKVL